MGENVSGTELSYLDGVTSAIQTQLDSTVTAASNFLTDNVILTSDGIGRGSQSTGVEIDDSNNMSGVLSLTMTAVAAPEMSWSDSDGGEGRFYADGANATDGKLILQLDDSAGSNTAYQTWDGGLELITHHMPVEAEQGTGVPYSINPSSPHTIDADICSQDFISGGSARTFNLPAEPECGGSGSGVAKVFCFTSRSGTFAMTIDPAAGDILAVANLSAGTGGQSMSNTAALGAWICLIGTDDGGTDTWFSESYGGTWALN